MSAPVQRSSRLRPEFASALARAGVAIDPFTGTAKTPSSNLDSLILSHATSGNTVTYHPSPDESFQALLDAIRSAKTSFHIETFIWHDDASGRAIAQALVQKVKDAKAAGTTFDAKVLIDSMGMKSSYGTKDSNILDYLKANGVDARVFNPGYVDLSATGMTPLSHRKLYIADGKKYLTGGRNIGDEYLKPTFETKNGDPATQETSWQDFLMTVEGTETATIEADFYQNWVRTGGKAPATAPKPIAAPGGHTLLQTFVTDPVAHKFEIRDVHLKAIAAAKSDIFLVCPYVADDDLVDALVAAKTKNTTLRAQLLATARTPEEKATVDKLVPVLSVRVLMPLTGEKGMDLNYEANLATTQQLLAAGVEVRMSTGGVLDGQAIARFSHLKAMEIDHQLLSLGSANADHRTYADNFELVNILDDPTKVAEFEHRISQPDWDGATKVDSTWLKAHTKWWERLFRTIFEWLDFLY